MCSIHYILHNFLYASPIFVFMKFNSLIPELSVSNFEKSLEFYTKIIGFKIAYQREESKFAFLSLQRAQIMIEQVNNTWKTGVLKHPFGRGINFQILVSHIDLILNSLKTHKYPLFSKPQEKWRRQNNKLIGQKEFLIQDPDGYLLRFAESLGTKPL